MKLFLKKMIVFAILFAITDFVGGLILDKIHSNIKIGEYGRDNYICDSVNADIVVLGSSRAESHYVTQMLEDSLGLSSYNCGQQGHTIFLNYARLRMISSRNMPKLVIYDITPGYDIFDNIPGYRDMNYLRIHKNDEYVKEIITDIDSRELLKLKSGLYKYNSIWLQLITQSFMKGKIAGYKGFKPSKTTNAVWIEPQKSNEVHLVDTLKLKYLERIVNEFKGKCKLCFAISPKWGGYESTYIEPVKNFCSKNNIPFFNYSQHPDFSSNKKLFEDYGHLNENGAEHYTNLIIREIKQAFNSHP